MLAAESGDPFIARVQASEMSVLMRMLSRGLLPSFVSDSSVVNSFVQETPDMILCHLWRAASSIFISIIQLEPTGLSVRSGVERIIDYYILSLLSI